MTTQISQIGLTASLTLISLSSGIWLNGAIAQVGSNQPVRNPGVSGISSPASSGSGGATISQPVTNPGVSGGNSPTPSLSQPNSTVNGSQPVTNPGTSGISSPDSSGSGGATVNQPVTNPGVSGISTPSSTQPNRPLNGSQPVTNPGTSGISTPSSTQPNQPLNGSQPITNPGTSGISTPSLTQPNQPTNSDTIRTIVPPSNVPNSIVQPRTNQTPLNRTPQVTQPVTPQTTAPIQRDNGTSVGFIRTAVSNQLADNPNVQKLDAQLLQATCSQNWQGAIVIVDRALESAPTNPAYRSQLRTYRNRLETLSSARTVIPNWSQNCSRG